MPIVLSSADSQIVLYAKGHFRTRLDPKAAYRILVGHRAGMDPKFISNNDIAAVLMLILDSIDKSTSSRKYIIETMLFGGPFLPAACTDPFDRFLYAWGSIVSGIPVRNDSGVLIQLQPLEKDIFSS